MVVVVLTAAAEVDGVVALCVVGIDAVVISSCSFCSCCCCFYLAIAVHDFVAPAKYFLNNYILLQRLCSKLSCEKNKLTIL